MTELELKIKFLKTTNPYEVVKCDMDCFSPYTYVETDSEYETISYWLEDEYLYGLQSMGMRFIKVTLKNLEEELSNQVDKTLLK